MAVSDKLNENFVNELFRLSLRNKRIFEIVTAHLKYQFLPNEHYKEVWKSMKQFYDVSKQLPTLGWLSQSFDHNLDVVQTLSEIRNSDMIDKNDALIQFELFLKNAMFIEAYDKLGEMFVNGQRDEAFVVVKDLNEELGTFVIREKYYDKVYGQLTDRLRDRATKTLLEENNQSRSKIPTGIDEIDDISRGGIDKGDTFLALAQSGVGKSKFLKHIGIHAARRGCKVLHIQAEGTREECLQAYEAGISGVDLSDIETGGVDAETMEEIEKATSNILMGGGEIYAESYEQFDTADLQEIRELILEIKKVSGEVDLVLLDYFELFDPGDGRRYKVSEERQRREALANKLKNIAVELDVAIITCTQASTVAPNLLNDPEFVQTRYHISEFKGVIKPFSYFVTMNQTADEKEDGFMRLFMDKIRKYRAGQTVNIYQNYDKERFYNRGKTIKEIYTPVGRAS